MSILIIHFYLTHCSEVEFKIINMHYDINLWQRKDHDEDDCKLQRSKILFCLDTNILIV